MGQLKTVISIAFGGPFAFLFACQKRETLYPARGPPCVRSNTCRGFKSHWNFCISLAPWLPPDFGLMKTMIGRLPAIGIGLTTNDRNPPLPV